MQTDEEPPVFPVFYSPPDLAETLTNGAVRHSGHIVADKTHSQSIGVLTISHLEIQYHCLELSENVHKIPNTPRSIHRTF